MTIQMKQVRTPDGGSMLVPSDTKIDVLAVMQNLSVKMTQADFDKMREARAAVSELIEAAETAVERLDDSGRSSKALRAALARVGAQS